MRGTGWNPVREEELLEAPEASIFQCKNLSLPSSSSSPCLLEPLVNQSNILVGVSPSIPLSSSQSSARLHNDVRILVYHNAGLLDVGSGSGTINALQAFLDTAKSKPETFKNPETAAFLAQAIGKKLFIVLLKSDEEVNIATALSDLGLDSLIAVEIRSWRKQMFNADISPNALARHFEGTV
ncbi:unnamed protein product [Clonostachys rhizophaga]|uniref:Carrier domain-containing protein n=1 Tax=Clonostachys rhizophaga TaxID=160324 RepID=A0A9N9YH71_9HYPO|nr:unnamed protein product [Clonostachys rhizophaga]